MWSKPFKNRILIYVFVQIKKKESRFKDSPPKKNLEENEDVYSCNKITKTQIQLGRALNNLECCNTPFVGLIPGCNLHSVAKVYAVLPFYNVKCLCSGGRG